MKVMMMSSFDEHIHFSRLLCDNLMLFYFWSSLMSNDFVNKVNWPLIDADAVMIKYSYLEDINMRKYKSFIILAAVFLILTSCRKDDKTEIIEENTTEEISDDSIICGDERFADYLPLLEGKRVALFTNQTGIVGNKIITADYKRNDLTLFGKDINGNDLEYGPHILDVLIEKGVNVTCVFSPEHGFRGSADAGAAIDDSIDEKTGVPLLSLYSEASVYPSDDDMERVDVASKVDNAVTKLNAVMENYPELRAHNEIQSAMNQNSYLQKEITAARSVYNDTVNQWNQDSYRWPLKMIVAAKRGEFNIF